LKIIKKSKLSSSKSRQTEFWKEVIMFEEVSHPSIIHGYEICHDKNNFYVVMEFITFGSLGEFFVERLE